MRSIPVFIPLWITIFVVALLGSLPAVSSGQDVSAAPFLQWFDSSYDTIENRMTDVHAAGYGAIWMPPPGRADRSNFSVGYDVYDRFDLGSARNPTLYGTETGIKTVANTIHRAGLNLHIDAIINHNGFTDQGTTDGDGRQGFVEAGGYPGFLIQNPDGSSDANGVNDPFGVPGTDGDFNSAYEYDDLQMRLAGLIDIDHATNNRFIRNPVPGFGPVANDHGGNLPGGITPFFGRLANVPTESNRRFYPDRDGSFISVFDPISNEQDIRIYNFNSDNPLAGDPVGENATGYLMRYMQWMVQDVGVDGFRIDAAKHVEGFTFDFMDRAVYRQNQRLLLDGSTNHVFSYGEVFDGNRDVLQSHIVKTINPNDPGRVGANRDTLDFNLHFALRDNLTGNGLQNNWANITGAGLDVYDDGLHNGSQGVTFVNSHDGEGPFLSNVAHAYTLMQAGNSVVYMNGKEFGDNRDFPKDGRGDALGGVFGDQLKKLVEIRNTHGRGNYAERWLEKEIHAFERQGSSLVLLSNRLDSGFDSRTLEVSQAAGTYLVELTGNAKNWNTTHPGDIAEVLEVFRDDNDGGKSKVNVRFLRNDGSDQGYLVYGLQNPQSSTGIELMGVSSVLAGGSPAATGFENGITRLEDLHVVSGDSFDVQLRTNVVNLLGSIRDRNADGDNALLKIDGGIDVNGNGAVDFVTPGDPSYGFEEFQTLKSAGYFNDDGNGEYRQTIDASLLSEGTHFITTRAFRHRDDGGPAVFSDFKKYIYVDRLDPISAVDSFEAFDSNFQENRDLIVRSVDQTANSVHVLWNLSANLTDTEILAMVDGGNLAEQIDRDLFVYGFSNVQHGNNVATVVTYEQTGTVNVQRFAGQFAETVNGRGLGDVNFDGVFSADDVGNVAGAFEELLYSRNDLFNSAADITGDGLIDTYDLLALGEIYDGADAAAFALWDEVKQRRADFNNSGGLADAADLDILDMNFGSTDWQYDLDVNGVVDQADHDFLVNNWLTASVPEPSSLLVLGLGSAGLLIRRRKSHSC